MYGMTKESPIQFFRLDEKGLAHIFGELEAKIMEAVWALGKASVQDVADYLQGKQHYKTLMTVMNRLVSKGALRRNRAGKAYIYEATQSRDSMLADVVDRLMRGLLVDFRDLTLAQIVETMETVDPAALAKLEALINRRRQEEANEAKS
jgi:predicted transcriptional regulator